MASAHFGLKCLSSAEELVGQIQVSPKPLFPDHFFLLLLEDRCRPPSTPDLKDRFSGAHPQGVEG
jgi:hypothetical protein